MLRLLKVSGQSLTPEYQEGDFVVTTRIPFFFSIKRLHPGDVVAFHHRQYGTLIKKIDLVIPVSGEIYVSGTHPDSIDSRTFGPIHLQDLIGKVIWHIQKPT